MNYELAKKLKDAGFPQRMWPESLVYVDESKVGVWGSFSQSVHRVNGEMVSVEDFVKLPTLSELIDACSPTKPDDFGLRMDSDRWHAYYLYHGYFEHNEKFVNADNFYSVDLNVYGPTPEEAVARLWLALNGTD
jgi:hypothetical protein